MVLSESIASSKALMDLERPTNRGITICGKMTISRKGSTGYRFEVDVDCGAPKSDRSSIEVTYNERVNFIKPTRHTRRE